MIPVINPDAEIKKPNVVVAQQSVSVVDFDRDPSTIGEAQRMDFEVWLPFAAEVYKISKKLEDFLIVTTPICPSDIPNRNGIGFPLQELIAFQPPPISRMSYKAWAGCPVHLEHKNDVHEEAYGVILDTSLHRISGFGGGKLWKVMGLLAIDKYKYRRVAEKVANGEINTYSMGAYVNAFTCSYCGQEMTKQSYCDHVHPKNTINWGEHRDYRGDSHLAFLNAHVIQPIETSIVESPAWTTALSDHILVK